MYVTITKVHTGPENIRNIIFQAGINLQWNHCNGSVPLTNTNLILGFWSQSGNPDPLNGNREAEVFE